MTRTPTAAFVLTLTLTLFAASAAGRQVESWPYDRLFKEADLVVIASAQGTAASDDKPGEGRWAAGLVGQRTTFAVVAPVKGDPGEGTITVVHFKFKDTKAVQNGPRLVAFRTKSVRVEGGGRTKYKADLGTPQYLLFLKRSAGGRYEPVSGQVDPVLSVREIYGPLPDVMDEK